MCVCVCVPAQINASVQCLLAAEDRPKCCCPKHLGNSHWSLFFPHLSPIRSPSTPAPHLFSSSFLPTTSPRLYHTIPVSSPSLFIFLDKLCQSQLDHYSNKQSSLKSKVFKPSLPSSISSVSGEFVVTDSHANHMHMKKKKRKKKRKAFG